MKTYDGPKIIAGLGIFLALLTFPVWYSVASGRSAVTPHPEIPAPDKQCVESAQYMREYHMELLTYWRESAVRDNVRTYTASDGRELTMSLATCTGCHTSKAKFCDSCHSYVNVKPNCWDCHNPPEGRDGGAK